MRLTSRHWPSSSELRTLNSWLRPTNDEADTRQLGPVTLCPAPRCRHDHRSLPHRDPRQHANRRQRCRRNRGHTNAARAPRSDPGSPHTNAADAPAGLTRSSVCPDKDPLRTR
jgi:hypothetical protein